MRLRSPWQPRLADMKGSPAERLVAALADDVIEGSLSTGERLPAHRDLAYRLGIGLGTVTKACAVLERRGLVRSVHGRGTFVAALQARSGPAIDLSINTPPRMLSERLLARTLVAVSRRIDRTRATRRTKYSSRPSGPSRNVSARHGITNQCRMPLACASRTSQLPMKRSNAR